MKYLVSLLFFANAVYAAQITGNGGDAVFCPAFTDADGINHQTQAELLDFYEARVSRGMSPNFEALDDTDAMIRLLIDHVNQVDSNFAATLSGYYRDYLTSSTIVPGIVLRDIPDAGEVPYDPVHCSIAQAAIQKIPRYPDDKRYLISGDIWAHLNAANRAGLIFHEIVYRQARIWGHLNSKAVRYFVAKVAAGEIHIMDAATYSHWRDEVFNFRQTFAWFDEQTENFWWFSTDELTQAEVQNLHPCRQLGEGWDGPTAGDFRTFSSELMGSPLKKTVWSHDAFSYFDQSARGSFWTATGTYMEFSGRPLGQQRYACLKKERN